MNPSIFFSRVFIQVYKGFYVRRIMYNVYVRFTNKMGDENRGVL